MCKAGGTAHRLLEVPGDHFRAAAPVEVGRSQGYRKGSILADWLSSTDTSVYAKVDRAALRAVARPWPGAGR